MKKQPKVAPETIQKELKEVVKNSFYELLEDIKKGNVNVQEFTQKLKKDCSIKKMELTGSLF